MALINEPVTTMLGENSDPSLSSSSEVNYNNIVSESSSNSNEERYKHIDPRRLSYTARGGTKISSYPNLKYYLVDEMKIILRNNDVPFISGLTKKELVDKIAEFKSIDKTTIDGYYNRESSHNIRTRQRSQNMDSIPRRQINDVNNHGTNVVNQQSVEIQNNITRIESDDYNHHSNQNTSNQIGRVLHRIYYSDYITNDDELQRIANELLEDETRNRLINRSISVNSNKNEKNKEKTICYNMGKTYIIDPNILSETCAICMDNMNYTLNGIKLTVNDINGITKRKCGHLFHQTCDDKWNSSKRQLAPCPLCRK